MVELAATLIVIVIGIPLLLAVISCILGVAQATKILTDKPIHGYKEGYNPETHSWDK